MSPHARAGLRARPAVLAASVVAALVAVPAALFATGGPGTSPGADAPAGSPTPAASATPSSVPGPERALDPTPGSAPRYVVGSGGLVPGTTFRHEPRVDAAAERALRRKVETLLPSTLEQVAPAPSAPPPVPVPEPATPEPTPVAPVPVAPAVFRVSSFNILGAAHTTARGTRPGFAPGHTRMRWAMSLLRTTGISVAGLQEYERPQHATFQEIAPNWDVFPGMQLDIAGLANSVVWNTGEWQLVEGRTIDIPYFHGRLKPMPYVLLRHIATGREVWFANFHNPASVRGPAAHWRREAVARETALANELSAGGTPVIMTGDMNDRAEFFCPITARSDLHAANGGSRGGPCSPPPDMGIDWIMGSPEVSFSDYQSVRRGLVSRTSDHPFVWATASVGDAAAR